MKYVFIEKHQAEFTGCGSNTDAFSKLQGFTAKFRRMLFTGFFTG